MHWRWRNSHDTARKLVASGDAGENQISQLGSCASPAVTALKISMPPISTARVLPAAVKVAAIGVAVAAADDDARAEAMMEEMPMGTAMAVGVCGSDATRQRDDPG